MIDARQIKAARALLDWSQTDLARAVNMAPSSIKNIEADKSTARKETLQLIQTVFEQNGLEFTPGSGIRLRYDHVAVHHGREATAALLDSIYETAHASSEREVCIIGLDESFALENDGALLLQSHVARLTKAGIRQRILICEGQQPSLSDPECYRWLPHHYFRRSAPIYIYGNKVAIHSGTLRRRTLIIDTNSFADHMRCVFAMLWEQARQPILPVSVGPRRLPSSGKETERVSA